MKAMVLEKPGQPLVLVERPDPLPGPGQIRLKVEACAVCRTDLHVVDGELERPKLPLVPGHEIVGVIDAVGTGVDPSRTGRRVGVPWLGHTCGACDYCRSGAENLCDAPLFTGYTRDGGFATHVVADADFAFDLDEAADPVALAPLLCAGLIGWRSLKKAGEGKRIGLYGFGAAAHIIAQVCRWQDREVYAFTKPGDTEAKDFARSLGAVWAGDSDILPPSPLDAAIIRTRRGARSSRLACGAQGRPGGLRRHPYERYSIHALFDPVGRTRARFRRKPHPERCRRVFPACPRGRRAHSHHNLPA